MDYRFERKWRFEEQLLSSFISFIKLMPQGFSEIHHTRQVNNIYFDDLDLENYHDSEIGIKRRTKFRIRWYGDVFSNNLNATLELKHKFGNVGNKENYTLSNFSIKKGFTILELFDYIRNSNLDNNLKNILISKKPFLVNSYKRSYYQSFDKRFRLTLDRELRYSNFQPNINFQRLSGDFQKVVMELKYDVKDAEEAEKILKVIPFKIERNSKYANGIQSIFS